MIFVDDAYAQPYVVLDADHFLRDVLFDERPISPEKFGIVRWSWPIQTSGLAK
jgi:hypothetical protein